MYVYDGLGNPTAIVADNNTNTGYVGYTYDPFAVDYSYGNSGGTLDTQNPYTYRGGIVDKTSYLVHFGNRFYNQYYGTWTQQDTLDTPLDPSNANRYAYAGDDPINGFDPTGDVVNCQFAPGTGVCLGYAYSPAKSDKAVAKTCDTVSIEAAAALAIPGLDVVDGPLAVICVPVATYDLLHN